MKEKIKAAILRYLRSQQNPPTCLYLYQRDREEKDFTIDGAVDIDALTEAIATAVEPQPSVARSSDRSAG